MTVVKTYKLKNEFENYDVFKRAYFKSFKSGWSREAWANWYSHTYNKQSVKRDIYSHFYDRDAWFLCIHEMTLDELNNIPANEAKNVINVRIEKIDDLQHHFRNYSKVTSFIDFEEDKYDYYSVLSETKRTASYFTVRVLKQ